MLNLIRNTVSNFRTTQATQDSNAFLAAAGITGQVQSQAIYNLVNNLQASGLWSKMKAVYPMVTDNVNQFSYSEDFSNAVWVPVNITIATNTATSPTGTNNADSFISTATNNPHPLVFVRTLSGTYTYSLYVKKNNSRYVSIKNVGGSANWAAAIYDLDNVVVTKTDFSTQTSVSASIQDVGNGWRRIAITSSGNFTDFAIQYAPNGTSSFATYGDIVSTGTGATDYYIWGAQLEASAAATTYQPIATTPTAFMASQMKYNLKDARDLDAAFRLTWSGGWTYSTNGAQPNGTNGWANTNLNPVGLINGTNSHMSYYSRTNNDGLYADLGHGGAMELLTRFGNVYYADYPDGTRTQTANSSSLGNFIISNTSANGKKVFKNASTLISSAFVNVNFSGVYTVVISNFNNLVPSRYSNRQFSFVTIGDGLTDAEAAILYQLTQQYQTTLSRQV